jgi:hypothetical protein
MKKRKQDMSLIEPKGTTPFYIMLYEVAAEKDWDSTTNRVDAFSEATVSNALNFI